jgi:outer membrane lipoprotein-sorting protein
MRHFFLFILLLTTVHCNAQPDAETSASRTFYALRTKVLAVHDYVANVQMKINVAYMRLPELKGRLYFKYPDKIRFERTGGISILPKRNMNLAMSNLIPQGKVMVLDAGYDTIAGKKVHIIKVIPETEDNIVLAKLWIDEQALVALRTETTSKDGTAKMELTYGAYTNLALPDKVVLYLDVKDYKLPKGITMDYDDNETSTAIKSAGAKKSSKGTILIQYLQYRVNTGMKDDVFNNKAE